MKTIIFTHKILFMMLMVLPLALCSPDDEDIPDDADSEEISCSGETNSSNDNYKLFDTDYLSSKHIKEGGDDDFSRKFIYNNGVFVCTGTFDETNFDNNGNAALYAVDEAFEFMWTFHEKEGEFYDVIHTKDNNYVAVGRRGNGDVAEIYVVKVNLNGELIWEYSVDATDDINFGAYATTVIENPSGGYIVTGKASDNSNLFGFGDTSFIFSLNEAGKEQWANSLSIDSEPSDIIINNDGNVIVIFRRSKDLVINELNTNGVLLNKNSFGSSNLDGALHVLQLSNNNYIVTGYTLGEDGDVSKNYGHTDIWVLKLDSNLNLIKEKTFGGFGYQTGVYTVKMNDNTLLLCAESTGNIFVSPTSRSPIFLRLTQDLCLIDWDDALKFDDYDLTDAIWLEEKNEIVTFSNENDRGNIYDTTDDFYHSLLRHKMTDN